MKGSRLMDKRNSTGDWPYAWSSQKPYIYVGNCLRSYDRAFELTVVAITAINDDIRPNCDWTSGL